MELVGIFIGFLFFLVFAFVGAIYAMLRPKGKSRWGGWFFVGVGCIGLFPLLVVLPPFYPNKSLRSGTYQGDIGGGRTTLILRPDGSFDQTFTDYQGKVYTSHGAWGIDRNDAGSIRFKRILLPESVHGGSHASRTPKISNGGGILHLFNSGIYFNEDTGEGVEKVGSWW